jgi:hypothetical protein
VIDQIYRASLGYSWSVGGVFWWYFAEDMPADPFLADALSTIRDDLIAQAGSGASQPPSTAASAAMST